MEYRITLKKKALKDLEYFEKHNKVVYQKINLLLKLLRKNPFDQFAKTEFLRFELSGFRSKRITKEHRLIYNIEGQNIIIYSCRFHY